MLPLRSLAAIGAGAADLVLLPLQAYREQHGSVARGVRRGASSFVRTLALEGLGIVARVATAAQVRTWLWESFLV
jgi:hypothetical protein